MFLSADVVFDVELIPYLVKTLHLLLSNSGDNHGKPVAYIASTIRNWTTYEFFINQLRKHNINWCEVNKPKNGLFYCDHSCEIKIIRLYLWRYAHLQFTALKVKETWAVNKSNWPMPWPMCHQHDLDQLRTNVFTLQFQLGFV